MHIIAIGWLWVAFMMAITQKSILAGASTFVFYGLLPCALLLYLLTTPARRRRQTQPAAEDAAGAKNEASDAAGPPVNAPKTP